MIATCEVIALMREEGKKAGEEIRFYVAGECVKTLHVTDPEKYGSYGVGRKYTIRGDEIVEVPA